MKLTMMRFLRRKRGTTMTQTPFDQEDELQVTHTVQPSEQEEGTPAPAGPTPPPAPAGPTPPPAEPSTEPNDDDGGEEPS